MSEIKKLTEIEETADNRMNRSEREARINELARIMFTVGKEDEGARKAAESELALLLLELDPGEYARRTYGALCKQVYTEAVANFLIFLRSENCKYDPKRPLMPYFTRICQGGNKKSDADKDPEESKQAKKGKEDEEEKEKDSEVSRFPGMMEKLWNKEYRDYHQMTLKEDSKTKEKKQIWVMPSSINQPVGQDNEGNEITVEDTLGSEDATEVDDAEIGILGAKIMIAIIPAAMNMWTKLQDSIDEMSLASAVTSEMKDALRRKKIKRYGMHMAYTENITWAIQGQDNLSMFLDRETELLRSMYLDFLDYFTVEKCRSVEDLFRAELKLESDIVPGKKEKECKLPLPAAVHIQFFDEEHNIDDVKDYDVNRYREKLYDLMKMAVKC